MENPLMLASAKGDEGTVRLLLEQGHDVNTKRRGQTALMIAAEQNQKSVLQTLLTAGARVSDKDAKGRSALSLAATRGNVNEEIIRLLINAGSPVDGRDLHVSVALREADVVKLLLSKGPDVNARFDWKSYGSAPITKGDMPLHVAAGDTFGEALIKSGSPLGELKPAERLTTVDLLIEAGADVNAQRLNGWTPLLLATNSDEVEIVEKLIQAGADPNREFECAFVPSPFSKPNTRVMNIVSAVTLAKMRPRNKAIRKLLLGEEE